MPEPFEIAGFVCAKVVDYVDYVVDPQEVAEVAVKGVAHRSGAVGEHIFHASAVEEVADAARKHGAVVLLVRGLSFAVEFHDVVGIGLEEIVAVLRLGIRTVAGVLDNIYAFVEEYERVGVGMGVVPCHA